MVTASDLGIPSTNLGDIPSKDERDKINFERAIRNLTKTTTPKRISPFQLPDALTNIRRG